MATVSSIGTVLIDCFQFLAEDGSQLKPPSRQIGGGGLFAIVGARVWLEQGHARILVDTDGNPPAQVKDVMDTFGEDIFVWREGRATGSASIVYRGQERTFEYINQPRPISPRSFVGTPLERTRYIHMCTSPADVLSTAAELASINASSDSQRWDPRIVWEPHPKFCLPGQLEAFKEALEFVDVCSPNHEEAAALFSVRTPTTKESYEHLLSLILACRTLRPSSAVVLRCGPLGSCTGTPGGSVRWVPAYWREEEQDEVRDVTGAGNSFLGGLVAGLSLTGDVFEANTYASVSASFVVQQFGLPKVLKRTGASDLWNGEDPRQRLEVLKGRVGFSR